MPVGSTEVDIDVQRAIARRLPAPEVLNSGTLGRNSGDRVTLAKEVFVRLCKDELAINPDRDVVPLDDQRPIEILSRRCPHDDSGGVRVVAVQHRRGRGRRSRAVVPVRGPTRVVLGFAVTRGSQIHGGGALNPRPGHVDFGECRRTDRFRCVSRS